MGYEQNKEGHPVSNGAAPMQGPAAQVSQRMPAELPDERRADRRYLNRSRRLLLDFQRSTLANDWPGKNHQHFLQERVLFNRGAGARRHADRTLDSVARSASWHC